MASAISPLCAIVTNVLMTSSGEGRMAADTSPAPEAPCQIPSSKTGTANPTTQRGMPRHATRYFSPSSVVKEVFTNVAPAC